MADVKLLPLPERSEIDRHIPTGIRVYGYTADDMHAYARANLAPLQAENERLRAEVERLMGCLATANANHEQFERQWYLERDRAERLAEALRNIRRAALDGCSAMDCARDAYDALALEDRNG